MLEAGWISTYMSRRVGFGSWYPRHPPVLVVMELALHQNSKSIKLETQGYSTVGIVYFQWRFARRLEFRTLILTSDKARLNVIVAGHKK